MPSNERMTSLGDLRGADVTLDLSPLTRTKEVFLSTVPLLEIASSAATVIAHRSLLSSPCIGVQCFLFRMVRLTVHAARTRLVPDCQR